MHIHKNKFSEMACELLGNLTKAELITYLTSRNFDVNVWNLWRASIMPSHLGRLDLSGANFGHGVYGGINLNNTDLSEANLSHADFRQASFKESLLIRADLQSAAMLGCNLNIADLYNANLNYTRLDYAILTNASLEDASLFQTGLTGANLDNANLRYADLRTARLFGANLTNADLRKATLLVDTLRGANIRDTKLPEGFAQFSISPVGSRGDILTVVYMKGQMSIHTGCFSGTLASFEKAVKERHGNTGSQYEVEYAGAIAMIKAWAAALDIRTD